MRDPMFITPDHEVLDSHEQPPPEDGVAADGRIHSGLFSAPVRRFSFDRARALGGAVRALTGTSPMVEWYGAGARYSRRLARYREKPI